MKMPELELPVLSEDASPLEAFGAMQAAGRSGVVIQTGEQYSLIHASRVADAVRRGVLKLGSASVTRRPAGVISPSFGKALVQLTSYEVPLFEAGPPMCFCSVCLEAGGPEGANCAKTPGCKGKIFCIKY